MITIKGTEEEIDHIIDCMIDNCEGCPEWERCQEENNKCNNCKSGKTCKECIEEGKVAVN